jgi:hypothetical protein
MDETPTPTGEGGPHAGEPPITPDGARQAMIAHAAATGSAIHGRLGGPPDYPRLVQLLEDPEAVRFPVQVVFDAGPLQGEELAYPLTAHGDAANGYTMYVHPALAGRSADTVAAVLYALVVVNYGEAATGEVGEAFGAAVLGVTRDDFYRTMCGIASRVKDES